MFRFHKQRSDKLGERFDFQLSDLQALQVPKGWDKLFLSIISLDTGKTIRRLEKAPVWNGNCQWSETISESIWISKYDGPKDVEGCLFKFVVTMGSSRSGILGEASVNLANYISSKASVPVSLQLKKCNQGTILQMKIHCLTPKTRDDWKDSNSLLDEASIDYDDVENNSDVSDSIFVRSAGSSSSNYMDSPSHPEKNGKKGTTFSQSGLRQSFDSLEESFGRKDLSPSSHLIGFTNSFIGRQDSAGSNTGSPYGSNSCDTPAKSNNSSFNSNVRRSGRSSEKENGEFRRFSQPSMSPLRSGGSSKELLEAVEVTVEELRAEARMWEKNARKLMVDIENLQRELLNRSEHQETLKLKLSASNTECHSLKQEIERQKILLEDLMMKQTAMDSLQLREKGADNSRKELEEEMKFQKETNANLALQLKKTQESNIELVSILQEMEDTIEKQKMEISDLLSAKSTAQPITDVFPRFHPDDNKSFNLSQPRFMEKQKLESAMKFLQPMLKEKGDSEIDQDCKTKTMVECEAEWRDKSTLNEVEIVSIEEMSPEAIDSQVFEEVNCEDASDTNLRKEIQSLKLKVKELEKDCTELTDENLQLIFKLKDLHPQNMAAPSNIVPNDSKEIERCQSEITRLNSKVSELQAELKEKEILFEELSYEHRGCIYFQDKCADLELQLQSLKDKGSLFDVEPCKGCTRAEDKEIEIVTLHQQVEHYQEQLQLSAITAKQLQERYALCLPQNVVGNYAIGYLDMLQSAYSGDLKKQDHDMLNKLVHLKKLIKVRIGVSKDVESEKEDSRTRTMSGDGAREDLPLYDLKEDTVSNLDEELSALHIELESRLIDLSEEMLKNFFEMDKLKADNLLKTEEVKILQHLQKELETRLCNFEQQNSKVDDNMKVLERGSDSNCSFCSLHEDKIVHASSMGPQVSADKVAGKLSELESEKNELEIHLSELEEENIRLSERICGLEAQLQYLTDERESSRLAIQFSESQSSNFRSDIKKLEIEMEAQKVTTKQRVQEIHKQLQEAQEECRYLKVANMKMQATAENLIEECSSLQKLNGELRKQNIELHEHISFLEAELSESNEAFSHLSNEIEVLEEKFDSLLEESALKEKALNSELNALLLENRRLDNIFIQEARTDAVKHSEEETGHPESVVNNIQLEDEAKVLGLIEELASSKQNQEVLMADHLKLITLLEDVKSNESKLRIAARRLAMKLKASEYERVQLVEEISCLKVQLQKIELLQNEVLALKRTISETTFEKERLETSHHVLRADLEEMKVERGSFVKKISTMQKAFSELEECKRVKVALQERILRLEGDLTAREALFAQEAELKNEVARIKRSYSQLQRRMKCLEEEKEECQKSARAEQEQVKHAKEAGHDRCKPGNTSVLPVSLDVRPPLMSEKRQKQSPAEAIQMQCFPDDQGHLKVDQLHEENNKLRKHTDDPDLSLKISFLQNELAEVLEANDMYKMQLKSLLSTRANDRSHMPKSMTEDVLLEIQPGQDKSSLEEELIQLRESYLHMSLRYAEAEAQREELVMKLKARNAETN
ncbi:sporulation-specific protein 15-like isoform X3 [Rhodamnia argentea]|uniref:Sporulation-specific protein 15-like isoform X3 n=1 Tax=Rhodamnia argentea TaxID=178133 RepID=A0A8B8Q6D5_9MYRT|nr:sporulation-specific protein 15-like isoform X3 [Rhodamnia argentea]